MYRIEHFVYVCLFAMLVLPSAEAASTDDALLRTINHIRPILLVVCSTLLRVCEERGAGSGRWRSRRQFERLGCRYGRGGTPRSS